MNLQLKRLERRFDLFRYLEQYEYKTVGNNAVLTCPQCERDEKLYVLLDDKMEDGELVKRGTWICYYCNDHDGGSGRTCLSLIEWLEDLDWLEAIKRLGEGGSAGGVWFFGAIEKLFRSFEKDAADEIETPIPEIKLPFGFRSVDEDHYPPYVASRGISVDRAIRFRLGYCDRGPYANRLIAPVYFDRTLV